jgi:dimethylargininase
MIPTRAIVRPPADTFPHALTRLDPPPPVDLELARQQHAAYEAALHECGLEVIALPPDAEHPDSVFVQDPVLVVDGRAIVCRSAAESRQGEADALVEVLRPHMDIVELQPPATLDGGDVLVTDGRVHVGLSTRSNGAACEQLERITGWPVTGIPLPDNLLHLLSGCTTLGANRLLVVESLAPLMPGFEHILVPGDEEHAANVLIVGHHAIVAAGYPKTAALVAQCGFEIHLAPMSEYEKRDGGVTCSSLLF